MNDIDPNFVKKLLEDNKYLTRAILNFQKELTPPSSKTMASNLSYQYRGPNYGGNLSNNNSIINNSNNGGMLNNSSSVHGVENRREYESRPHGWSGNYSKK